MARLYLPCHGNEVLLPQDIDQVCIISFFSFLYLLLEAVDVFLRWLEREPSTISHYLDRHPPVRDSFLAAVQQVADHRLLPTPAGTPAEEDLDDEPAEPASEEIVG